MKKFFFSYFLFLNGLIAFCQNPQLLKDVYPGITDSGIQQIVKTSNYTFFNAEDDDANLDRGLYRTDGTPGGTVKLNLTYLPDPPPSVNNYISTKAEKITALGDKIVFAGDNFAYYGEIWVSDGTQSGTIALERFQPSVSLTDRRVVVMDMAKLGNNMLYGVVNDVNHSILKKTDGTPGGTSVVYDFSGFASPPDLGLFKTINNILYFNVYDIGGSGIDQLWRSDGTTAGTYMLKDFGLNQYVASTYMTAGDLFYWMVIKPGTGNVLWKSDGTAEGTVSVKTIGTTGNNNYPHNAAIGSTLYFAGLDGNGKELWKTDGTEAGTMMVQNINAGAASSNPTLLTALNNNLYFYADGGIHGNELWKYDGTSATEVLDIYPGSTGSKPLSNASIPTGFVESNGTIVFNAANDATGQELWITDGTAANTKKIKDINPLGASNPSVLTPGNPVYFSANNGVNGAEIFKYDNSEGVLGVKNVWLTGTAFGSWTETGVIQLSTTDNINFTATNIQIIGTGGESSYFKFTEGTWASVAGRSFTTPAPGFPTGVTELSSVTESQGVDNVITGTPGYWNVVYNYNTKAYSFTPTNNWGIVGTATPNGWGGPDMPLTYDANSNKLSAVVSLNTGEIKFRNNNNWSVNYGDNGADGSLDTDGANIAITAGSYLITLDFNTLKYSIKSALVAIPDPNFEQALIDLGIDKDGVINASISRSNAEAVTELNVNSKNINSLQGIEAFTNLSILYCQYNQIQVLDISNNTVLTVLECGENQLTGLNVTQNPLLKVLGFGFNNISQIDVSQNLNLEVFWCNNNNITSQNLDLNSKLTVIGLSNNPLNFVSLKNGNNVNVVYFEAYNTPTLACINADAIVSVSMSNSGKTFSENCSTTSLAGSWIIAPETRALKVGPTAGSDAYWYLNKFGDDISARACYLNDKYVFDEAGSFKNVLGSETYLETWQGVASERCGAPVAPHGGTTNASYVYNQNAGTITLNGPGAYLGLPKAVNGYQLPSGPVPNSITYTVSFSDNGNVMSVGIYSGGVFWTYKFIKESGLKTYYVNDNLKKGDVFTSAIGNNYNIGTKAAPFATLNHAVSIAKDGDTIYVDTGSYSIAGDIIISKSITILGTNYQYSPNDAIDKRILNTVRNAESLVTRGTFIIDNNNISIQGITMDPLNGSLANIGVGIFNRNFSNISLMRNRFQTRSNQPAVFFIADGPNTISVASLVSTGFTVTDNRFEKYDSSASNTIVIGKVKNVSISDNAFVVAGATIRNYSVLTSGGQGVNDAVIFSNNTIDKANQVVIGPRLADGVISGNKIYNSTFAINMSNVSTESSNIEFSNNILDGNEGVLPFINYNRLSGSNLGASSVFKVENNTMSATAIYGTTTLLGSMNLIFQNSVLNPSVIVRGNTINIGGDLSTVEGQFIRPIMLRGKLTNAIVENNELTLNATNLQPGNPNNPLPACPAITLYVEDSTGGNLSNIQPGSIVNILNNKINGFTHSFVVFDPVSSITPYVGFGNLPDGVTVNVNNNSFTGDVMSINNGGQSQAVNASCNWYGSAAAQDFITKITLPTVDVAPWLTNGTDNDAAIGFQQVPNSCDGNPTLVTLDGYTNVTCNGAANGSINITTTYGKVPFVYTWTKDEDAGFVSHDEDPIALAPGVYHLTLVDGNGSTLYITDTEADGPGTIDVTITEPTVLTATADGINNLCFGESTGTAFVIADGGTAPYTYLWNNGAIIDEISNLSAGTYSVTVTDANGCTINASYEVTQPTLLTASITNNSTACSNNATVTASDGTPGYTYLWSNGATTATIDNVPVGTYTVTVTDDNGCSTTASITLTVGEAFNPSASATDVSCFGGSNGTITVTNANGTAPFTFSKDGINFISGTFPYSFNNLSAGTYNIAVKDANGCTGFVAKTIAQPALLTATILTVQKTCSGQSTGAISVATAGGSGALSYSWTGTGGFTSSQKNINNLAAGSYVLTVTDNNGCTALLNVVVLNFNPITVSETITNVLCRGSLTGAINLTVSGGSGSFAYSWTGNTTATSEDISNLGSGTNYNVTITDIGSGCITTKSYVITQPASNLSLTTGKTNATGCGGSLGTITATASGGTFPYEYKLDNGIYQSSGNFTLLSSGSYTVWAKDANGCTSSKVVAITDNGSDQYESNNSKSQAKLISIGPIINARIALATDTADWFKFTPTSTGNYKLTITHPTVNYTFNLYPSTNNAAALVPTSPTLTSKTYALTGGLTYFVQITGGLSFKCYDLSISTVVSVAKYAVTNTKVSAVDKLSVKAYPNPHQGLFNLSIISPEDGKAQIELFTILGQLLAKREVSIEKDQNTIVEFNDVGRGMILYHITIGNQAVNGKVYGKD